MRRSEPGVRDLLWIISILSPLSAPMRILKSFCSRLCEKKLGNFYDAVEWEWSDATNNSLPTSITQALWHHLPLGETRNFSTETSRQFQLHAPEIFIDKQRDLRSRFIETSFEFAYRMAHRVMFIENDINKQLFTTPPPTAPLAYSFCIFPQPLKAKRNFFIMLLNSHLWRNKS